MAKRGRPRKNDVKGVGTLARAFVALEGHDSARMAGEKYSEALKAGVAAVHQIFPNMSASQTDVKRARAELQPRAHALGLWVAKPESSDTMVVIFVNGRRLERIAAFGVGPRPNYPRHNATDKPRKKRAKTDLRPPQS